MGKPLACRPQIIRHSDDVTWHDGTDQHHQLMFSTAIQTYSQVLEVITTAAAGVYRLIEMLVQELRVDQTLAQPNQTDRFVDHFVERAFQQHLDLQQRLNFGRFGWLLLADLADEAIESPFPVIADADTVVADTVVAEPVVAEPVYDVAVLLGKEVYHPY